MAYTTEDLQRMFEDAWDACPNDEGTLRNELRKYENAASKLLAGGSANSHSASGRSVSIVYDGRIPGALTTKDAANAWRALIALFDDTSKFLRWCNTYGLDPALIELNGAPTTPPAPVQHPAVMTDADVAEWFMGSNWMLNKGQQTTRNWVAHLVPIVEYQGDYSWSRIPPGAQWV